MLRILLVDDELDVLNAVSVLMALDGFEVETATDGYKAFQIALERPVDIVLTDWMMPNADGIELRRLLRADARTASIPIIINSAARLPASLAELFDASLPKPCNIDRLLGVVNALLAHKRRPPGDPAR